MPKASIHSSEPLPVKCVLISMYEYETNKPGEFQYFQEAERLNKTHAFSYAADDIWTNYNGLVALTVGIGAAKAASTTMAFGLDPRFDLTHAYFLIAGIAGINPQFGSLACTVWANYCVDGDLAHEIDAREIPSSWSTGIIPLGCDTPYSQRSKNDTALFHNSELYTLDSSLSDWAYKTTQSLNLSDLDNDLLEAYRGRYLNYAEAQRPPFVLKGDNLSATRYWHGKLSNQWAERWVEHWTGKKGRFVTSTMEDAGTLRALSQLAAAHRIDWNRILLLRSASNFTMQAPDGMTPLQSLLGRGNGNENLFPGYIPSLRSLQRVGSKVINKIIENWDRFKTTPPT